MVERSFYLVKTVFDKIIKKATHSFKNGVNAFINNRKLIFRYSYSLVFCDIFQRKIV